MLVVILILFFIALAFVILYVKAKAEVERTAPVFKKYAKRPKGETESSDATFASSEVIPAPHYNKQQVQPVQEAAGTVVANRKTLTVELVKASSEDVLGLELTLEWVVKTVGKNGLAGIDGRIIAGQKIVKITLNDQAVALNATTADKFLEELSNRDDWTLVLNLFRKPNRSRKDGPPKDEQSESSYDPPERGFDWHGIIKVTFWVSVLVLSVVLSDETWEQEDEYENEDGAMVYTYSNKDGQTATVTIADGEKILVWFLFASLFALFVALLRKRWQHKYRQRQSCAHQSVAFLHQNLDPMSGRELH